MGLRKLKRKLANNKSYKKSGTTDMMKYYLMDKEKDNGKKEERS